MGIVCEQRQCRAERAPLTLILTTHAPTISPAEGVRATTRRGGGGGVGCTAQGALARALSAARSRARQTLQFQTVQHQPTTTDCQPTLNNGIQVFVTGKLAVQLRPSPRHLPAPTLTVRSPAPPPPRPPPPARPAPPFLPVAAPPSAGGGRAPRRQWRHTRPRPQARGPRRGCAQLPPPAAPHRSTAAPTR